MTEPTAWLRLDTRNMCTHLSRGHVECVSQARRVAMLKNPGPWRTVSIAGSAGASLVDTRGELLATIPAALHGTVTERMLRATPLLMEALDAYQLIRIHGQTAQTARELDIRWGTQEWLRAQRGQPIGGLLKLAEKKARAAFDIVNADSVVAQHG